jgi:bifunctional UDP-N-acetylglucosamine pyrophosphorylase/glucosamine-1-phosphate N-acetyltransferase
MGTRMKSAVPKAMHAVAGRPLLGHVIEAARGAGAERIVVVASKEGDAVCAYAASLGAETAIQAEQLGTGHAALCAGAALAGFDGSVLVNNADMPLVTAPTLRAAFEAAEKVGFSAAAFRPADPARYGRVILDRDGLLDRIVEYKDASEAERRVDLCCAGSYAAARAKDFFRWAASLDNDNVQKEYYLPQVPTIAKRDGVACAVPVADAVEVMGVNSRAELAEAEAQMQTRLRAAALEAGVGMTAPQTVFLSYDTVLEADAAIGPYVVFGPGVTVKSGAEIRAFSHLEGAVVETGAIVGPYARLRPGAHLEEDVHIGNFVEVKKTRVEKGAKANHLAYLGDARVGAGANIGAGTITCNYDGFDKFETDIGANAFIGSNTALVAPVKVGDGAYVGAGSTIAKDGVLEDALALARAARKDVAGWAAKFRARKRAAKAGKDGK